MGVKFGAAYRLHVFQSGDGNETRSPAAVAASIADIEFRSRLLLQNTRCAIVTQFGINTQLSSCERAHGTNNIPVVARTIRSHAAAALANGMHAEKLQLLVIQRAALTRSNECLLAQSNCFLFTEGTVASCGCTSASGCRDEYGNVAVRWTLCVSK